MLLLEQEVSFRLLQTSLVAMCLRASLALCRKKLAAIFVAGLVTVCLDVTSVVRCIRTRTRITCSL